MAIGVGINPIFEVAQSLRRTVQAATKLGNHSFRATGITAYLKNGGHAEDGGTDGEPCQHAHDATLRPKARGT
jgi:hypothetical protein